MTQIVINDVENLQDLYAALALVTQVFTANPEKFDLDQETFSKRPPEDCECDECQPAELAVPVTAAPMPYIPCPDRGTHVYLTDCWACWCDVRRGAALEVDVLDPAAWDIAAAALMPADENKTETLRVPTAPGFADFGDADTIADDQSDR